MTYATVDEFLNDLPKDRQKQLNELRTIIKSAHTELIEHIKWNAPSYVFKGEDRITFNTHYSDKILIVLHMGATRKEDKKAAPIMNDEFGLVTWNSDIRGTSSFISLEEINKNSAHIASIIKNWLTIK